jgi:crotonobetainyl-CoA:carnitine CoA-transferase CaiB-like acyl-CoA transferase
MGDEPAGPLAAVRVLDVSGAIGAYCTKLLADLGADVLLGEPPDGDGLRRRPPFVAGRAVGADSLTFGSYHANKRGITIDVSHPDSLPVLEALGRHCEVVVASPSSRRPVVGFDRDAPALDWAGPDAVIVSITPFGLSGPLRDLRMTPFLSFAMGGGMQWVGPHDGPPLAAPGQLQWDEAGIHAAYGAVVGVLGRERVGGQVLDLSVHEVAMAKDFLLERYDRARPGEWGRRVGVGIPPTGVWACADGPFAVSAHQNHHWSAFLAMLDHPDALSAPSLADQLVRREIFDGLESIIAGLMAHRHRQELFAKGQAAGLPCAPVNSPGEFVRDPQPRARRVFTSVPACESDTVSIPWRWAHSSAPLLGMRRPPPRLGQHNRQVYVDELGFTIDQLERWQEKGIV